MTHDCVICFEEIADTNQMIKTPCGHTFHNSCLTPWFMAKDTCPMCRKNYGKEREQVSDSDEEWDSEEYDSEEEDSFTVSIDFDGNDDIMESVLDRISLVCEDPIETTSDWVLNRVNGEDVYCVYSLIRDGDSLVRIDFEYNKDTNHLDVYYISKQVFNKNKNNQVVDNWVFKRRANGYFNPSVACRV
jgi:hypothetical protein